MRLLPTLQLLRPINCLFTGVAVLIGGIVTSGRLESGWVTPLAFAVAGLVAAGGYAINDYFDREVDRVNRPWRPIPSGKISAREALAMAQALFAVGVVLSAFLNEYCLLLAALNSFVLTVYSWRLKRRGLPGNISIGYLVGSTFLFGGLAFGGLATRPSVPAELLFLVLMAALSTVGRELIKNIEDMRGDLKLGFETFPLRYGARAAASLGGLFIGSAVAISPIPYLLGIFGWAYLVFVVPSIAAFLLAIIIIARDQEQRSAGHASLVCKVAMGLGLLAFLTGAWF